jgi:hypothetical protein
MLELELNHQPPGHGGKMTPKTNQVLSGFKEFDKACCSHHSPTINQASFWAHGAHGASAHATPTHCLPLNFRSALPFLSLIRSFSSLSCLHPNSQPTRDFILERITGGPFVLPFYTLVLNKEHGIKAHLHLFYTEL